MQIKQLQQDVEILKKQNIQLQEELANEKDERIKMSMILCNIIEKLNEKGIKICEEKEKVEVVEEIEDPDYNLTPENEEETDDEKSLPASPYNEEQEKRMKAIEEIVNTEEFLKSSKTTKELFEKSDKYIQMNKVVDSLDNLSDNEDFDDKSVDLALTPKEQTQLSLNLTITPQPVKEETPKTYSQLPETLVSEPPVELPPTVPATPTPVVEEKQPTPVVEEKQPTPVVEEKQPKPTVDVNCPPLPSNLRTSPMTPPAEEVVEEEPVEEQINYSKMKVGELKKMCKERGIKGYSKLKKKQLIELLQ